MKIKNSSWGVWGFGVVGKSVARFLHDRGAHVSIYDQRVLSAEETIGYTVYHPDQISTFIAEQESIVPSPGINIAKDYATFNQMPYLLHQKHVSELDLFSSFVTKPVIAVTGSVGKTTVTRLLSLILEKLGYRVLTGGNIGLGMCDLIAVQDQCDYIVLELSSFQLEYARAFSPHLAIITPLYPNHLDRHGSMEHYCQAKLSILRQHDTRGYAVLPASLKNMLASYPGTVSWYDALPTDPRVIALPPITFAQNWDIILKALTLMNIDWSLFDTITPKLTLAQEHRLELVATINGVTFYNDSKSTTAASTLAAIDYCKKSNDRSLKLILGGLSKGVNRLSLIQSLRNKVDFVYTFGQEAEELAVWCAEEGIICTSYNNLESCMQRVFADIKTNDTILFSPGGSSYDLFKDYQERGNAFKTIIHSFHSLCE